MAEYDDWQQQEDQLQQGGEARAADYDQGTQFNHTMEDIYNELLGRGSDSAGYTQALKLYNPNDAGSNYGANNIRQMLMNSDEYRQRQSGGAAAQQPASVANQQPAMQQAQQRAFSGSTGQQAVGYTRNPQLDELMAGMISNQKAETERQAREADERAAWRNQMRGNIMTQYDKAAAPVDPNDPIMSRARQVHDAAGQRSFNAGREAMAARGAMGGTPTGASDAYLQSSSENLAKDQAGYESDLYMNEVDKRRQQIGQLLGLGSGVLTADENRMLQEKMGTLDSQMKQLGMSTNAFLSGTGLDQNQQSIGNQNNQFYDKMGYDVGLQEALMNQQMMQMLMGGGG